MNYICPDIIHHFIFVFFIYFFYHFSCRKDQFTVLSLKFVKRESTVNIIPVQKKRFVYCIANIGIFSHIIGRVKNECKKIYVSAIVKPFSICELILINEFQVSN